VSAWSPSPQGTYARPSANSRPNPCTANNAHMKLGRKNCTKNIYLRAYIILHQGVKHGSHALSLTVCSLVSPHNLQQQQTPKKLHDYYTYWVWLGFCPLGIYIKVFSYWLLHLLMSHCFPKVDWFKSTSRSIQYVCHCCSWFWF
jgi:hypothetical protein